MYKKTVSIRNVTVALNLTDSLNVSESALSVNLSRVMHTIQVGKRLHSNTEMFMASFEEHFKSDILYHQP